MCLYPRGYNVKPIGPSRTTGFRKSDLSTHLMCLYPRGYTTRHGGTMSCSLPFILVPSRTTGFRKSDLPTHLMCLDPRGYTTRHGRSRELTAYTAVHLGLNTHNRCACTPGGTMFNTCPWSLNPGIALTTVLHINPVPACPIGHVSL